jgi:hypothetical protein
MGTSHIRLNPEMKKDQKEYIQYVLDVHQLTENTAKLDFSYLVREKYYFCDSSKEVERKLESKKANRVYVGNEPAISRYYQFLKLKEKNNIISNKSDFEESLFSDQEKLKMIANIASTINDKMIFVNPENQLEVELKNSINIIHQLSKLSEK